MRAHLPTAYPSQAAPLVVLEGHGVTPAVTDWAVAKLDELFVPGEAVLYTWAEAVRELLDAAPDSELEDHTTVAVAAIAEAEAAGQEAKVRPIYPWTSPLIPI